MKVLFYIGILLIIAGVSLFLYLVFRKPESNPSPDRKDLVTGLASFILTLAGVILSLLTVLSDKQDAILNKQDAILQLQRESVNLQSKILKELKGMRKDMHSEHQKIIQLIKQE